MKQRIVAAISIMLMLLATPLTVHALTTTSSKTPTPAPPIPSEGINLQISPLPIELNPKPGTSVEADLRVRNVGPQTERLQARLLSVNEDNNGGVHLGTPGPGDDWVKWVSFDRPTFDAPSNDWQTVKMTVNVPNSAAFGYYFAVEFLRADQAATQPNQTAAHGAVATFILLDANSPGAKRQAQIVSFTADRKYYEFLPTKFTVKVHSTGNVHVAPHGNIFILKGGKQVGSIAVNADEGNVLPKGSRLFASNWNDGFPVYIPTTDISGKPVMNKKGKPESSLKWDFSHANRLRFGHYTAHLVMVYDDGQRDVPIEASVQFWVIPWRVICVLIIVGLFVGIGIWSTARKSTRFVRKHSKKGKKSE